MTDQEISLLAVKVASDTKFWISLVGLIGVVTGSALTLVGNYVIELHKSEKQRKIDAARQKLLKEMLQDGAFEWRHLKTLSSVVGCNEEQTKEHLIAIAARGSEKDDGLWGLISRHPLSEIRK